MSDSSRFDLSKFFERIPAVRSCKLLDWCERNGFKLNAMSSESERFRELMAQTAGVEAFTTFIGDTIFIPLDKRDEALDIYGDDMESNKTMFFNQVGNVDHGIRFVLDIDTSDREITDLEINQMGNVLNKVLRMYYTKFDEKPIIVYSAKCSKRLKGKCENLSTAVHFVCNVQVNVEQARQMTYAFELELKASKFNMSQIEVDSGIYKDSGRCNLRALYSHKIDKCPQCKDVLARRITCELCNHAGSMMSRRTYEPWMVYGKDGETSTEYTRSLNDTYRNMSHNYSIWSKSNEAREDYERPDVHPLIPTKDKAKRPISKKQSESGKVKTLGAHPKLTNAIRNFRCKGERLWEHVDVDCIKVPSEKRGTAYVYLTGLCSSVCPYKGGDGDHGGNRGYFKIGRTWSHAEFYCRSEKYGCSEKPREKFELSKAIVNDIFGVPNPPSSGIRYNPKNAGLAPSERQPSYALQKRTQTSKDRKRKRALAAINNSFDLGIFGGSSNGSGSSGGSNRSNGKRARYD